jgi:hypothetical protein
MDLFTKDDIVSISACASKYKLLPWVKNIGNPDWHFLTQNPNAIHMIEEKIENYPNFPLEEYSWCICVNPNTVHLIEKLKKVSWEALCKNPGAIHLIEQKLKSEPESIYWYMLCANPGASHLIEERLKNEPGWLYSKKKNGNGRHGIDWFCISRLCENNAIFLIESILKTNPEMIDWGFLVRNPDAMHLVKEQIQKNDHICINMSENPGAIDLIKATLSTNPDSINLYGLATNPLGLDLVKNLDKKFLCNIWFNPSIFELEKNKNILSILSSLN